LLGKVIGRASLCALVLFLALCSLWLWPVDVLFIKNENGVIVSEAVLRSGHSFETRYVHSVQLSLVEDLYMVRGGRIWQWRGRVSSQNAGLPTVLPGRTRYRLEDPWLVFEGRLPVTAEIVLRVGDSLTGRNCLRLGQGEWEPLYGEFAGKRLYLSAGRRAFGQILFIAEKL
jgi:hypothetical protein